MSFLSAAPELVTAAATDLANIGSTITEANARSSLDDGSAWRRR